MCKAGSDQAGPLPGKRIAAQLAARVAVSKDNAPQVVHQSPNRSPIRRDGGNRLDDRFVNEGPMDDLADNTDLDIYETDSPTEPSSGDEEEHNQWKQRLEKRDRCK